MNFYRSNRFRPVVKKCSRRFRSIDRLEERVLLAGDLTAFWQAENLATEVAEGEVVAKWTDSISGLESVGF